MRQRLMMRNGIIKPESAHMKDILSEVGANKNVQADSLLPCPFCGQPPEVSPSGEMGRGLMIECLTTNCINPHVSYYDHDLARKKWNTRRG